MRMAEPATAVSHAILHLRSSVHVSCMHMQMSGMQAGSWCVTARARALTCCHLCSRAEADMDAITRPKPCAEKP